MMKEIKLNDKMSQSATVMTEEKFKELFTSEDLPLLAYTKEQWKELEQYCIDTNRVGTYNLIKLLIDLYKTRKGVKR